MRYMTALKVAALALGLGGAAMICQAQQVPGGSYQQSCRDIGVRGSSLYATCKDEGGNWRSTQLSDFQRCSGEIQNLNGNLQCTGGNNGNGNNGNYGNNGSNGSNGDRRDGDNRDANRSGDHQDADHHDRDQNGNYRNGQNGPDGSYTQTCQNIQVSGNTLQASCQKKNGKVKNSTLRNFQGCRDIQNDNGKLRCSR